MARTPIYVTRPVLPPLDEFIPLLEAIWNSSILTNGGPMLKHFENELTAYLGVEHITITNNATLGMVLALRHLGITGEVITTPFSFIATTHAITLAGATPVFADIELLSPNIDPAAVETLITPRTQAILAVHCFGLPCNTRALRDIADRHGLHLIYDAAHAFGVTDAQGSVLARGDLSVLSFHATKVFNSFEGGAIISRDRETKLKLDRLGNFGIVDEVTVEAIGLNAKMSEVHAAMGIASLSGVDSCISARSRIASRYAAALADVPGITFVCPSNLKGHNFYAFPVLVGPEYALTRDELYERMRRADVHARRYFHPLISDQPMYRSLPSAASQYLPNATRTAARILNLPIYPELTTDDQDRVIELILAAGTKRHHVRDCHCIEI